MKTIEKIIGVALLILCIALGSALLKTDMVFFRWVMGLALGYVLPRPFCRGDNLVSPGFAC